MRKSLVAGLVAGLPLIPQAPAHAVCVSGGGGHFHVTSGVCEHSYSTFDQMLCPTLAGLAPGVPGVVDINLQGDVFLAGEGFFDCPPYGDVFPPGT